jgi:hypothetical protein
MRPALDPNGHRVPRTKPTCLLHTWRPHRQRPFVLVLHLHQHESSCNLHLQYLAKNQSTQRCLSLITQGSDHPPVLEPHMVLTTAASRSSWRHSPRRPAALLHVSPSRRPYRWSSPTPPPPYSLPTEATTATCRSGAGRGGAASGLPARRAEGQGRRRRPALHSAAEDQAKLRGGATTTPASLPLRRRRRRWSWARGALRPPRRLSPPGGGGSRQTQPRPSPSWHGGRCIDFSLPGLLFSVTRSNLEVAAAAVGGVKEPTQRPPARRRGRGSGWGHACCPQARRRIELDMKFPRQWRPPWIRRCPSPPHLSPPPSSSSAGVLLSRRAAIWRPPHGAASLLFRTTGSRHFPGVAREVGEGDVALRARGKRV